MGGGGIGRGGSGMNSAIAAAQAAAEAKKKQEAEAFKQLQAQQRPGIKMYQQTDQEKRAGVNPASFESMRDLGTGELLSQYKFDPYAGEATQKLKEQAFAEGESPWAKLQLEQQKQGQMEGMDQASKQQLQAMSQGQAGLAMGGGLSTGARERMARGGARDLMAAKQGIARQGIGARLGIRGGDIDRKQQMLGQFADVEKRGQEYNLGQAKGDIERQSGFDVNRYNEQMRAWAAAQSASAQRDAAKSSQPKSSCCFILLEARYGTGVMDKVVRRYRDEFMTPRNKRGYYKLAEVLVPLMRKYKVIKFLVQLLMADPLVSYGKWHYGQGKIGWVFAPIKSFWLKTFDLLGPEVEFIRETGEVV